MGKKKVKIPVGTIISAAGMIAAIQVQKQIADAVVEALREDKVLNIRIDFSKQEKVKK